MRWTLAAVLRPLTFVLAIVRLGRPARPGDVLVSVIAASLTHGALEGVSQRRGAMFTVRRGGWLRAVDLDELLP